MNQSRSSFFYERDFSQGGANRRSYDTKPQLPVAYAEHIRELEAVRLQSFNAGVEKGKAEQKQSADDRLAHSLEQMSFHFAGYAKGLQDISAKSHQEAVSFALLFAKKLAAGLILAAPLDAIEATAREIFEDMRGSPHLAMRVNPSLVDACKTRIESVLHSKGMECKLIVFPDPEVAVGNCKIEWADGGILRDQQALLEQIEKAVTSLIPALAPRST